MTKYRLYLDEEIIKRAEEEFESDGTIIDAEKIIKDICSDVCSLSECLINLRDVGDVFSIDYARFKIIGFSENNDFVKFLSYYDAIKIKMSG